MKPTIESLMKQSSKLLKVYGIERPRHESILILKEILKKSYVDILSNGDLKIPITETNKILENLFKRLKGKPLSKISGVKEFFKRFNKKKNKHFRCRNRFSLYNYNNNS